MAKLIFALILFALGIGASRAPGNVVPFIQIPGAPAAEAPRR
jgi:hypothetical protein